MKTTINRLRRALFVALAAALTITALPASGSNEMTKVKMTTSMGVIEIEVDNAKAPISAANFIEYVKGGFYDGLIFHRVIPGFMVQGGGFEVGMTQKETRAAIENEADNGLKNDYGTLAMARTGDPHSATAQFFINVKDNEFLNFKGKNPQGWGYAVFGKVSSGIEIVEKIVAVETGSKGPYQDVPVEDVIIEKAEVVE